VAYGITWLSRRPIAAANPYRAPDARRRLQLVFAAVWLLDAALQFQPFMFTKAFSGTLAGTAAGNPAIIADPITWNAGIVTHYPVLTNSIFATIQLLLAAAIACRPTVKIGLAGTVVWSLGVWWFGEGLGGVLTGTASPLDGAPGAVILYALLAALLWPPGETTPRTPRLWPSRRSEPPFVAARPLGAAVARLLWLALWGSLAYFAVQPAGRTPQGLHDTIAGMADGEPHWIASMDGHVAGLLAHQGGAVSIALAAVFAAVAAGIFLPAPSARAALTLAALTAALIWVAAQNFGAIFTGSGTDPNSGPLLALLVAAYWPAAHRGSRSLTDIRNPEE